MSAQGALFLDSISQLKAADHPGEPECSARHRTDTGAQRHHYVM
ncbi:MAG: hypothetical protein OJF49_004482 [Ktedonobacterales bacterium]|nr:MAG: hypothetical protein OJF49_004482 [Ktedonobacterales bacterium]